MSGRLAILIYPKRSIQNIQPRKIFSRKRPYILHLISSKISQSSASQLKEVEGQILERALVHFTQTGAYKMYDSIYLKFKDWLRLDIILTEVKVSPQFPPNPDSKNTLNVISSTDLIGHDFLGYKLYHTDNGDHYENFQEMGIDLLFGNNMQLRAYSTLDDNYAYPFPFTDNYWEVMESAK